eukprot:scaffold488_cov142-Skeletonema_menzelii.AAC.23
MRGGRVRGQHVAFTVYSDKGAKCSLFSFLPVSILFLSLSLLPPPTSNLHPPSNYRRSLLCAIHPPIHSSIFFFNKVQWIMSQGDALITAAVEHLRTYAASLCEDDICLIKNSNEESSLSTLPKIKYWIGQLKKALQSETRLKDDGIDFGAIADVLASMLRILDDTDVQNLQIQAKAIKPMKRSSQQHFQQTNRRKRLPVRSSDLVEAMHESQEIGFNNNSYDSSGLYLSSAEIYHRAKRQKNICADVNVSVKDVLNAKTTDFSECTIDTEVIDSNSIKKETAMTALLLDAAILRRDLYKLLVDVDSMNIRKWIKTNASDKDVKSMVIQTVASLLRRINAHPDSPSMRLSAIMTVDWLREIELSDIGYQMLLDELLTSTLSSSEAIHVKFYADIVSECTVYASPSRLLHALVRVMRETLRIKKITEACGQDSRENEAKSKSMEKNLLQAISQIMVRRSNILHSLNLDAGQNISKLYSSYKLMIRRISTTYDKVSYWTHSDSDVRNYTQEQAVSVLQAEGILSLFCWDETDDEQSETSLHSQQFVERSHPLLSLRAAHDRLGPCLGFDKLLSHSSSYTMKAQSDLEGVLTQDNRGTCSAFSGINSDVLHGVFLFLGYRSLARASSACKNWNLASNDTRLWIALYFRRYKAAIYEEEYAKGINKLRKSGCFDKFTQLCSVADRKGLAKTLAIDSHYNWRYIFKRKYQTEKHVSKTLLRCKVIGCTAHYGKRSIRAHKQMHEKVVSSRAMAIKALEKVELDVISLRDKDRLLDVETGVRPARQEQPDDRNVICMHSPEDALARVFTFLDANDLLKPICKMWTKVLTGNDVLWKSLYSSHFGLPLSPSRIPESWSACFRSAFKAEKERRNIASHNSLGWPTMMCPYLGCCEFFSNQLAYSKHVLIHEEESLRHRIKRRKKKMAMKKKEIQQA